MLVQALVALILIYILIDLLSHRQVDIVKFRVPGNVVAEYYLNFVPQIVSRVAPLALLVAALLVIGDAAQHNEITAVQSGGISLQRFVAAPIFVATAYAAGLFGMAETVGAAAARKAAQIEEGYFSQDEDDAREGLSWANLSGKWTCHVRKFNRIALTGEDVLLHARTADSVQQVQARRIYWDEAQRQWMLEDGRWFTLDAAQTSAQGARIRLRAAPFTEPPETLFALEGPTVSKTIGQLERDIAYAAERRAPTAKLRVDYHARFAQPALSFVTIWLAIPFALRLRRGGLAVSFGISITLAITYLLVYSITMSLGHAGRLSPPLAAWLANGVFFLVGLVLFVRTRT